MKNILVVDDDYQMRAALSEALIKAGYEVASAEDGRAAMESVKKSVCDLVITDVKMPYINGIDLLGRIKKEQCSLPVIVVTAYGTVEHAVNAMKEGAFDYIQKPFDTETLYGVVERALGLDGGKIVWLVQGHEGSAPEGEGSGANGRDGPAYGRERGGQGADLQVRA